MRQTISGLVAAIAVMAASAVPAMACGGGLFQGGCSPCGQTYVSPCEQSYVPEPVYVPPPAPVYSGCNSCGGGWGYERLPDPVREYHTAEPVHQYYYADQGPTYTGPGNFAPYPVYREGGWGYRHHYHHHYYGYAHSHGYGYRPHHGYAPHHTCGYGYGYGAPHHYGYHQHALRRYY
jgi:hypothetical protein